MYRGWPGDNTSDWAHLRGSIPLLLGMGLSGFPFVGSDIGGLWDVIADGVNGFRIPVNDSAALAAKIRALFGDPEMALRMKTASREKAREFDGKTIAGEYEKLLRLPR